MLFFSYGLIFVEISITKNLGYSKERTILEKFKILPRISGISNETGKLYKPSDNDEVEDLYMLLQEVKEKCEIEAVSVGAILSDYQRVRVENV